MLALLLAVVTGQANDNITLISGYIFDGGTPSRHAENTKWCTDKSDRVDGIWYCEFHTASPVRVDGYRIITGDDNLWYNDRNPMNWELKAKVNSYDDWMTIAKVDYDNVLEDDNFRSFDFMVDEPGVYQYFRYEVSDNQGADDMQMEELQLFYSGEAASEVETITFISDYIYDGGTSSRHNTPPNYLVDGDAERKTLSGVQTRVTGSMASGTASSTPPVLSAWTAIRSSPEMTTCIGLTATP